ncbi:hypothetical protein DRP04_03555, partial [Archaeoglobales archaeon]
AATIYVPDDYATINWAITNATAGDTIVIRDGFWYENVVIDRSLIVKSENGSANCIIDGQDAEATVKIIASDVILEGITARNASGYPVVTTYSVTNVTIKDCIVYDGDYGISALNVAEITIENVTVHDIVNHGLRIGGSVSGFTDSVITNLNIYNCTGGIRGGPLDNVTIRYCKIHDNSGAGIYLVTTNNTTFYGNEIYNNGGIGIDLLEDSYYNIIQNNKIYNNSGAAGIFIHINCSSNVIKDNIFYNNYRGIWIFTSCTNNTIENNTIYNNDWNGIVIDSNSDYNIIRKNNASYNANYGIRLVSDVYGNIVEDNIAINNSDAGFICHGVYYNILRNNTARLNAWGLMIKNSVDLMIYENELKENINEEVYIQDSSNITFIEGTFYSVTTEQWEISIWNATVALPPHLVYYSEDVSITNQISNEKTCFYISGARLTLKKLPMQVKPTTVCNVTITEYSPSKVRFTADAPEGETVTFTLGGLEPSRAYLILKDGEYFDILLANVSGVISFTNSEWSSSTFEIFLMDYLWWNGTNLLSANFSSTSLYSYGEGDYYAIEAVEDLATKKKFYEVSNNASLQVKVTVCGLDPSSAYDVKCYWANGTLVFSKVLNSNSSGCICYYTTNFADERYTVIEKRTQANWFIVVTAIGGALVAGGLIIKRFRRWIRRGG